MAAVTCFSTECTSYNSHRPVRLCNQCHKIRHNTRRGADHVIYGSSIPSPWFMEMETQNYHVKAVVSLLQEARPFGTSKNLDENHRRTMQVLSVDDDDDDEVEDEATLNERRLLSRYRPLFSNENSNDFRSNSNKSNMGGFYLIEITKQKKFFMKIFFSFA